MSLKIEEKILLLHADAAVPVEGTTDAAAPADKNAAGQEVAGEKLWGRGIRCPAVQFQIVLELQESAGRGRGRHFKDCFKSCNCDAACYQSANAKQHAL